MSDIAYVGKKIKSFDSSQQLDGYSKVVVVVDDDTEYSAGTDTGRTLTLDCPWGTQEIANNILASIRGYQYQPYSASGALLDPAAELGDGITVNDVYSGIYEQDIKFGSLFTSDISAPSDEEIDHEYPYIPKQDRSITRKIYGLTTELKVQDGLIAAEVSKRESDVKDLYAALKVQSDAISAEVTQRESDVKSLSATLKIQGDAISAEVTQREKDIKDLSASLKVESNRITAEVSQREKDVKDLTASLELQAGQISAKVSQNSGDYATFGWNLMPTYWEVASNFRRIFYVDANGAEVYGKLTATSGKIGGYDILSDCLSFNGHTWGGTNTVGVYIGVNGIQLGRNFIVDSLGNLYATSGTFSGFVRAGSIQYGDDNGYFSGSGLASGSVYGGSGGALAGSTLSNYNMTGGINTSLGYADFANGVFNGWNTANYTNAHNLFVDNQMTLRDSIIGKQTLIVATPNGGTATIRFLSW